MPPAYVKTLLITTLPRVMCENHFPSILYINNWLICILIIG